jgi:hypothetical protein
LEKPVPKTQAGGRIRRDPPALAPISPAAALEIPRSAAQNAAQTAFGRTA